MLFELDARALEATVRQMQAAVQRDRALVANNAAKEKRYAELLQQGFISADAYNQIKTDLDAARATAGANEAALESARVQLSYTRIVSPITGRAGKVMIQLGNVVKANDTLPLVTINAVAPIYVSFAVPEQNLPTIRAFLAKGRARGACDTHGRDARRERRAPHLHRQHGGPADRHDPAARHLPESGQRAVARDSSRTSR